MPKYLLAVNYTSQGAKGLLKEGGSKRKAAAEAGVKALGGSVESFYFALGDTDVYVVADLPDHVTLAALSLALNGSGAVTTKSTVLLTPAEVDEAAKKSVAYTPPGSDEAGNPWMSR